MRTSLKQLIEQALDSLSDSGEMVLEQRPDIPLERSKGGAHGDFASPLALSLARSLKRNPRVIAEAIVAHLPASDMLAKTEIAGPGYINFFLADKVITQTLAQILSAGDQFGFSQRREGVSAQVEFVSANPTGPLHVGHGRGAAFGSVLANLLEAAGYPVQREYYVNDAGRQMDILALSLWLRFLQGSGEQLAFPTNAYQGEYIKDLAEGLPSVGTETFSRSTQEVFEGIPEDNPQGQSDAAKAQRENHIDALIARTKSLLGELGYAELLNFVLGAQIDDIRADLKEFRVEFDQWFSEQSLKDDHHIQEMVKTLRDSGDIYDRDGTAWFRSSHYGDEKDRVVVRSNGQSTYFASDIAYLDNKFKRGFEHIIYVWGADHHGYVARLMAACKALGHPPEKVEILLVQFASLYRAGEKVQMSTRSGEFVSLRELRDEVGVDAARFFYVMRRCEQHLDFDLDLARSQSSDNPVYYLQYAHARIVSILAQAEQHKMEVDASAGLAALDHLSLPQELEVMKSAARYPEVIESAAQAREPHQVCFYLRELAAEFHAYYTLRDMKILCQESDLRNARLVLCMAVRQVLANGLQLLGVSAPKRM